MKSVEILHPDGSYTETEIADYTLQQFSVCRQLKTLAQKFFRNFTLGQLFCYASWSNMNFLDLSLCSLLAFISKHAFQLFCKQKSKRFFFFFPMQISFTYFVLPCAPSYTLLARQVLGDLAEVWQKYESFWKIFLKALPKLFSTYRICDDKWVYHFRMDLQRSLFKTPYLYRMITKVNKDQASQNISFLPPSILVTKPSKQILDSFICSCLAF